VPVAVALAAGVLPAIAEAALLSAVLTSPAAALLGVAVAA
jgi:hypothetical protein